MTETTDSGDHLLDGVDRDDPQNRPRQSFRLAANLVDDLQELRQTTEADLNHYAGSPRGMTRTENRER